MDRFLESFSSIDWIKNLIQFAIYLSVIVIFFLVAIFPLMSEFKSSNIEFRKAEIEHKRALSIKESRQKELNELQANNQALLVAFTKRYEDGSLDTISNDYFREFKIVQKWLNREEDGFVFTKLKVQTTLKSSLLFYEFLLSLNNSGYIVKSDFPIEFSGSKDRIESSFFLNIYTIDEQK